MKLFEIPVYALSREDLKEQVDSFVEEEKNSYAVRHGGRTSEEHMNELIAREINPQCAWDYNHIAGFVAVVLSGSNIEIEWYSPYNKQRKYNWRSKEKVFIHNNFLVGFHFSVSGLKNGNQLRNKLNNHIRGIEEFLHNEGYYVDTEAFDRVMAVIDYDALLKIIRL